MARRLKLLAPLLLLVGLVSANIGVYTAHAHNWGSYHWDGRKGTHTVIQEHLVASHSGEANAAHWDAWNNFSILYNYAVNYHTDIEVFDEWKSSGWSGLATIVDANWDWGCWCYDHIGHAHAEYNTRMGWNTWWVQGVFCQEMNHGRGFDHDNTGGCMGLTYFSGSSNVVNGHNSSDFYNRYINGAGPSGGK